ncbi:hypothetical protein MKW92_023923, partial [Papaver armeniacum]
ISIMEEAPSSFTDENLLGKGGLDLEKKSMFKRGSYFSLKWKITQVPLFFSHWTMRSRSGIDHHTAYECC